MWVKICGITTMKAAVAAYEAGADAVGFVFAPSKRQVDPDRAQALIMGLPGEIDKVGVFVDEEPSAIRHIAAYAGLTHVQLHGSEPPEAIDAVGLPVIKAFRVRDAQDLAKLPAYAAKAVGLLLDPYVEGQSGGTGKTLDWSLAAQAHSVLREAGIDVAAPDEPLTPGRPKLILAGGLSPENVSGAIRQAQPGGVDVSSGVETDGTKDVGKIYNFMDLAKGGSPE